MCGNEKFKKYDMNKSSQRKTEKTTIKDKSWLIEFNGMSTR